METQVQETPFVLDPLQSVQIPSETQAKANLVPVDASKRSETDGRLAERVENFVSRVTTADLQSDQFRELLDRAFQAGRKEITDASGYIDANPLLRNATTADLGDDECSKAMAELGAIMAKANPKGKDLLGPVKVLGIPLPFGDKLRSYLDDFKPLATRMNELIQVLEEQEDDQRKEIAALDIQEGQLFEKLQKLDNATAYLSMLDARLTSEANAIRATNPEKAKALEEEVLYYVRGNLNDVIAHKVIMVTFLGQTRQLRHTGRMTVRSTQRIRTLGMDALAVGQGNALAAHKQMKRAEDNRKAAAVVNDLIAGVGDTIERHTKQMIDFESNPVGAISAIESSVEKTLNAINLYNNFRAAALTTMQADSQKLQALYSKAKTGMRIEQKPASTSGYGDVFSI
ncbi:toxic anion resistance protein [Cupriavidus necator]